LSDLDAISTQIPDVVIALTGDFNSLHTADSFVNNCGLVMLKDSATHGKRFSMSFYLAIRFIPLSNSGFMHKNKT
jgi:hypothetical protein